MKLVLIFGASAVGKMTVGQELAKITDLRLFHNHISIEPVLQVFGYKDDKVIGDIRKSIFSNFAKSDNSGLIFTYVWDFNCKNDWKDVAKITKIFKKQKSQVYYVELDADFDERLKRNETENRLKNKPSKNNIEFSKKIIENEMKKCRVESYDGEIKFHNYLKINNTNLSAEFVAKMIKEKFDL